MTATQAPTPGPLSADWTIHDGGECPFDPGTVLDVLYGDGEEQKSVTLYEGHGSWAYGPDGGHETDVVAYRVVSAPTAPVEASGSERDALHPDAQPFMHYPDLALHIERMAMSGVVGSGISWDAFLHELNKALRPQPSGETRGVPIWIKPMVAALEGYEADYGGPLDDMHELGRIDDSRSSPSFRIRVGHIRDLALLSARPLALGGQQGEDAAWAWLNQHVECDPADRDYSADEMVDAFMAGNGRYDRLVKALERIAGEQQHRSGYCQTDITVEPALTAEEAQTVAREALSTTPARAEAQDEDTPCTDCGDTGVTHQTERRCSCQEAEAQDEGAEMTRLLKLADSALANVTAFEDDARYIMGNTNYAITENARSEIRSFLLAQSAKTSVRPKALEILERLLDHSGARGSFDAMKHGDAVKDAEELLRSARSPGHTDLMVTPESIDAYMRVNPMEAQDEGAAGELKPCPFCGGEAEIIHLDDGDNAGGSCVCCTKCQASGNVEFGRKENFVENWNRRAHPSPTPAADADRVRIAVEALEKATPASPLPGGVNRRVKSELNFIKDIAANVQRDLAELEDGFSKSQRTAKTDRAVAKMRERCAVLMQCADDAFGALPAAPTGEPK